MQNRIIKLRDKMIENNVDCVILNNFENRFYFSGFTGSDGYLIITDSKNILITDSRYTEQAKTQSNFDVIECRQNIFDLIKEILLNEKVTTIGIEEEYITYSEFKKMSEKLDNIFKNVDEIIKDIRVIKDDLEIESIKYAVNLGEKAFQYLLEFIRPNISELDIALELEFFLRKNGAQGMSFDPIVASGSRSSLPHGEPSCKKIKNGDFIVLDFGCKINGYCSDMTRTIAVGSVNEEQKKIYNIVLQAQLQALDFINKDILCSEVDKIAREYIASNGYGEYFGHSLGHGVGLNVHESPTLSTRSNTVLKGGMVVTIEPGIYVPNFGGVRIEDMVIIRDTGVENLMKSDKQLIVI